MTQYETQLKLIEWLKTNDVIGRNRLAMLKRISANCYHPTTA